MEDIFGHQFKRPWPGLQLVTEGVDEFGPLELSLFVAKTRVHPRPDVLQDMTMNQFRPIGSASDFSP